eukprot:3232578-Pyramimonas_sp.AAC.1
MRACMHEGEKDLRPLKQRRFSGVCRCTLCSSVECEGQPRGASGGGAKGEVGEGRETRGRPIKGHTRTYTSA